MQTLFFTIYKFHVTVQPTAFCYEHHIFIYYAVYNSFYVKKYKNTNTTYWHYQKGNSLYKFVEATSASLLIRRQYVYSFLTVILAPEIHTTTP